MRIKLILISFNTTEIKPVVMFQHNLDVFMQNSSCGIEVYDRIIEITSESVWNFKRAYLLAIIMDIKGYSERDWLRPCREMVWLRLKEELTFTNASGKR